MARYRIPITTWVNSTVDVEVPDHITDPDEIAAIALDRVDIGSLCHQCGSDLELGDEWQAGTDPTTGKPAVTRLDG